MSAPARCLQEARAEVRDRKGAWIGRAVDIIQTHNKEISWPENRGRCPTCSSNTPLLWDTP